MSRLTTTAVLAERNLARFFRSPELLAGTLAFPIVLLLVMLVVFGEVVDDAGAGHYVDRLAPGIVLFSAGYAAVGTGLGFLQDLQSGFRDRLRQLPISHGAVLAGRVAGDLGRLLVVALVTVAGAYIVGFRFSGGVLATVGFFVLTVVFGSVFLWLGMVVALTARDEQAVSGALSTPVTLLLLFSSALVPLDAFPGFLQRIVEWNPLSLANDTLMRLASDGDPGAALWKTIAWLGVLLAVLIPLALRLDRRQT